MYCEEKKSRIFIFTTLLFLVASCAGLNINPPGPGNQTLLVLPVTASNTSSIKHYGFHYKYEITNDKDDKVAYEAIFKLPNKSGFILVDSLPPGKYYVSSFALIPVGSGDRTYGDAQERYIPFKLEFGSITIFQNSLNISVINHPTQSGTAQSLSNVDPVSSTQEKEILATLKQVENFDKWNIAALE